MYTASNFGTPGRPRPRFPDAGPPGRAVAPAALNTVREADASMAGEDWVYAPSSAPAAVPAAPATAPAPATPARPRSPPGLSGPAL